MLPRECINAFNVPHFKAGGVSLRPLTLGDVVMIEQAGISLTDEISVGDALLIANLLIADSFSLPLKYKLISTRAQRLKAVSRALQVAFSAVVRAKKSSTEMILPTGYGWPLEVAEMMMAEYHMCFEEAANVPLARAFALAACARVRKGGAPGGPDYYERITLKEMKNG